MGGSGSIVVVAATVVVVVGATDVVVATVVLATVAVVVGAEPAASGSVLLHAATTNAHAMKLTNRFIIFPHRWTLGTSPPYSADLQGEGAGRASSPRPITTGFWMSLGGSIGEADSSHS
jgi:hypothetical protein